MAKRIKDTTRDYLKSVPLPVQTASYTVISHESVMDYAAAEIAAQGFTILSEQYRCTADGQIAQGVYKLNYNSDPEMSLMFAWSNSYNKQVRFKCATGAIVNDNNTVMLLGELGTWARKHTGTADAETIQMIKDQFTNAQMYYDNLVQDKEVMKTYTLTTKRQSELLGVLFAEHEVLTTEQASIIRQQMTKPSFFYNGGVHTLWAFYNHVTVALQSAHPRTWMQDQRMLHWFISNEFDLSASAPQISTTVDPLDINYGEPENQTNLLVQIAEVTGDESVLAAQYPVTEEEAIAPTDEVIQYTDPAGNTFEAPVVPEPEPEIDESTLSPFQKMQLRLERANKRAMEEQTKAEEVVEEEPITVEEIPTVTSFVLTPEEMEEHKEELEQFEAELEVAQVNTSESQQVKDDLDFSFDLSNDEDNESSSFDSDFL
jgi:hypothetical protein